MSSPRVLHWAVATSDVVALSRRLHHADLSAADVEISLPFLVKVVSTGDDQASFELEVKTWPAWEMEEFLAFQGQEAGRLSIDMQPGRDLADEESRGILR